MLKSAIGLFLITAFIFMFFLPSFNRMQELRRRNNVLEVEIAQLKKNNKDLVDERKLLIEDPVYLEKVAREKMGLVKEGEVLYRMNPVDAKKKK